MNIKGRFNILLNILIPASIVFFIFFQLSLPLWHDEIYQFWYSSKDFNFIVSTTRVEANYPLHTIIYKILLLIVGNENFEKIVLFHFLSLAITFFSFFLLRKVFSLEKILMLVFILFSSEYFLRFFFELRTYGFVFSWSLLFSTSYILASLRDDKSYFYLLIFSGLFLSAFHPISGLFVVSVMLKFIYENVSAYKRFLSLALIFISCFFVLIFSSGRLLMNEDFHINSYYIHIRNTGVFMIPVIITGFLLLIGITKTRLRKILLDISPIIFSVIIIYSYSIITSPFYQGRYFTAFFPFLSLFLIKHLDTKYFLFLKVSSLLLIIFLYGPRAATPYTNFEGIIENSHLPECEGAPLFIENDTGLNSDTVFKSEFDKIVYYQAQELYSDIKRPILSSKDTLLWWYENYNDNNCRTIGMSIGDNTPELNFELKKDNNLTFSTKSVESCTKNRCGVVWNIN